MSKLELHEMQSEYNRLWKEADEIYRDMANHFRLSECAMWIVYIIRETEKPLIQSEICDILSLSKQTVNSALKILEADGYIALEVAEANQRSKWVALTTKGNKLAERTADRIISIEQDAFSAFSAEERRIFIGLMQKYINGLRNEADKILSEPATDMKQGVRK